MAVYGVQQGTAPAEAQDAATLRTIFEAITAESCPNFYNFHIHTNCSDGKLRPDQVMEQAIAIGLQGFAITDHHNINGYLRAQQWLEDWRWKNPISSSDRNQGAPRLWTGVEINAQMLNIEVHILCYAFNPDHSAIQLYLQGRPSNGNDLRADKVIDAVHRAGGITILAHPARYRRSPAELIPEAARLGIDGVETYYAYNNPCPWKPSPEETYQVSQLSQAYGLLSTCGTDTHGLNLLQRL